MTSTSALMKARSRIPISPPPTGFGRPKDQVKRWDRTRYFVDNALDFLRRHKDQPCYVEIWPDDVHTPWVPNLQRQAESPNSAQTTAIFATCSPSMTCRWAGFSTA